MSQFHLLNIDNRILKSITRLGWTTPTPIQQTVISLANTGKDIQVQIKSDAGKLKKTTITRYDFCK